MKIQDPNKIFIDAICGEEISEIIASAIVLEIEKSVLNLKTNQKYSKMELKKSIEIGIRKRGPKWLKILIKNQDHFRIKH